MPWGGFNCGGCCPVAVEQEPILYDLAFADYTHLCQINNTNFATVSQCCNLILCGPADACSVGVDLDATLVKTWLQLGNKRLFVAGEYDGCFESVRDQVNTFLSDIGSSMSFGLKECDYVCDGLGNNWLGISQAVGILNGLPGIGHNTVCEVLPGMGTPISFTNSEGEGSACSPSFCWCAGESLYGSVVVIAGDSNVTSFGTCNFTNNFQFFNRLLTLPIGGIL